MQDPRVRLGVLLLLSIASFISITGAFLTLLWWLLCARGKTSFGSFGTAAFVFILPAVAAGATEFSGGDGISYFFRISLVLVIASWAYSERYPGEFLDVSFWLLGRRYGFDLGLVGEMSLSTIEIMIDEFRRTRIALAQKGQRFSRANLSPVITSLLIRQFRLARERAVILALRGYQGGGSLCPSFATSSGDIIAGVFSVLIFVVSLIT